MTLRAVLVGAVESSRIALEAIVRSPGWTLAAVVTLPPDLARRHSDFVDLGESAANAGAPLLALDDINRQEALAAIAGARPDYLFVIGWSQICRAAFRALTPDHVIGYHPAALPRMRGRAAIPWTILNRDPITAGTLFWIDAGTDTGPTLDQQFFHVAPEETAATLYAKHMQALRVMLDRTLTQLANGTPLRTQQDEACATWAARRTPADGRIDWTAPASEVLRLIRATGRPYPGAFTLIEDRPLRIWRAEAAPVACHLARPGQVVARAAASFDVMCGGGAAIRVVEWSGCDRPPRLHIHLDDKR